MSDDELLVQLDGLAYGGSAVGSVISGPPESVGKRAFVRGGIPGELVTINVLKEEPRLIEAEVGTVMTPTQHRVDAPCSYFGRCGGCDYQHIALPFQREEKRRMVEVTLQRQARVVSRTGVELVGSELPGYQYRRRVALHVDRGGKVGFFARGGQSVVDIDRCLLAEEPLSREVMRIRPLLQSAAEVIGGVVIERPHEPGALEHDAIYVVAKLRDTSLSSSQKLEKLPGIGALQRDIPLLTILSGERIVWRAPRHLTALSGSETLFPAGHFSQVNRFGNAILLERVYQAVQTTHLTDLYAGAGNLSLPLARRGISVEAVEVDAQLVTFGNHLAEESGISGNVRFHAISCEDYVKIKPLTECVLLDPPRAGAKEVVKHFSPELVRRVVYVSCNLPTLGRDLQALLQRGFAVERVDVLDMFPQTHHVETITTLTAN